jgi:hypothetical protein
VYNAAHIRLQGKIYGVEYFFHKLLIMNTELSLEKMQCHETGEKRTLRYAAQNVVYLAFMSFCVDLRTNSNYFPIQH